MVLLAYFFYHLPHLSPYLPYWPAPTAGSPPLPAPQRPHPLGAHADGRHGQRSHRRDVQVIAGSHPDAQRPGAWKVDGGWALLGASTKPCWESAKKTTEKATHNPFTN